ncbi:bactofilin family protein [Brevundimonas mediterranea]|uniref:Cytoskeletal protein CcmA (Bactofilin family) n=1 Tax=Brevundimonas mediterranea TaxID=74329 RepID=A0A7W6A027_9CAUL|nr:polymer-forming cytoskeletal protein [Brevundimonas mediterranea]MBB3870749.1 cytoskeletal protein CcmA (bactofilin family) [Brevundimonas mediterranea]
MFNKISKPSSPTPSARPAAPVIPPLPDMPAAPRTAGAAPSAVPTGRGLSTLSSDLVFEGNVSGAGDLQIDGQVKGDVRVGRLIVGETGAVEGNVQADYVEVRGRVVGGVQGKQVKLVATAYVDGDITAEQLSIDVGAFFQGRVAQGQRQAPAPAAVTPVAPVVQAAPPLAPKPETAPVVQGKETV